MALQEFEQFLKDRPGGLTIELLKSALPQGTRARSEVAGHQLIQDFGVVGPDPELIQESYEHSAQRPARLLFSLSEGWNVEQQGEMLQRCFPEQVRIREVALERGSALPGQHMLRRERLPQPNSFLFNLVGPALEGTAYLHEVNPSRHLLYVCARVDEFVMVPC
jgi:hypothetical protein